MERRNQSAISNQPGDFFLPPYTIGAELSAKYREVVYQEMPQDTAERRQVLRAISPKKIAYWERVGYSDDIAAMGGYVEKQLGFVSTDFPYDSGMSDTKSYWKNRYNQEDLRILLQTLFRIPAGQWSALRNVLLSGNQLRGEQWEIIASNLLVLSKNELAQEQQEYILQYFQDIAVPTFLPDASGEAWRFTVQIPWRLRECMGWKGKKDLKFRCYGLSAAGMRRIYRPLYRELTAITYTRLGHMLQRISHEDMINPIRLETIQNNLYAFQDEMKACIKNWVSRCKLKFGMLANIRGGTRMRRRTGYRQKNGHPMR